MLLQSESDCVQRIDSLNVRDLYTQAFGLPRKGWVLKNINNPETVGQHQIDAALLVSEAFFLENAKTGLDLGIIQDTLLIHDLAEIHPSVGDITPHCGVSDIDKRRMEVPVILEYLDSNLQQLWFNYEYGRTDEGRVAMELDKLQAILKARFYENLYGIQGLAQEFYTYSVERKRAIYTPFLVERARKALLATF